MRPFALVFGVLAGIAMLAYAMPLFGGVTFAGRDHLTHTLPSLHHVSEALRAGHVPQWWDAIDLGVPFAANPNHSAWYPPLWLTAALPMPWGADAILIAHVVFAGAGVALLARRLGAGVEGQIVAGASFMLSGFVTSTLVLENPLLTLAWAPWVACAADRVAAGETWRARLLLVGALGAQLLAGDPSFAIIGVLVAFAIVAVRAERKWRALAVTALACIAAAVLAAIVIVPALALFGETLRAEQTTAATSQVWSMHPSRILEWISPDALGDPNQPTAYAARAIADTSGGIPNLGPSWLTSVYVGLPVVLLAIVGWTRRLRWLAAWVAGFVVLALGSFTPVYAAYRAVFVPERLVRYPEKYLCGALLLACAMAGVGFTKLVAREASRRTYVALAAAAGAYGVLVIVVAIAGTSLFARATSGSGLSIDPAAVASHVTTRAAIAFVALALAGGALALRRRAWIAVAALATIAPLVAGVWDGQPLVSRARISQPPQMLAALGDGEHDGVRTRLHRVPADLPSSATSYVQYALERYATAYPDIATRFGYADVPGYDQAHWARTARAFNALARPIALATYGVALAFVPAHAAAAERMTPIGDGAAGYVLARPADVRPRAFVTTHWQWAATDDDVLAVLSARRTVDDAIVLRGPGTASAAGALPTPCSVRAPTPERVELRCHADASAYAVLLDAWAPGWSATVDGAAAPIEQADLLARAVAIPAGDHAIVFEYHTPGLALGFAVSVAGWLAWGVALVVASRRRKLQS